MQKKLKAVKKPVKKFRFGKLQEFWLSQLEKYPERQTNGVLGTGNGKKYRACCLGELHLCHARLNGLKLPFINGEIIDGSSDYSVSNSWEKYGLRDDRGKILKRYHKYLVDGDNTQCETLAFANDANKTWTEIAAFIRKYPKAVFTKSV